MDLRGFEIVSAFDGKDIHIPERTTAQSAGYDIEAGQDVRIEPGDVAIVPTGLKAFMGYDEYLSLHVRSSIGIKKHLMLANCTGIIDSDYYNNVDNEGHIMIALHNWGTEAVEIHKGDRIAQGIFSKYLITSEDHASGERMGGIGSTGA